MVYKRFMPNQRAADKTLIAFALQRELLRGLDTARAITKQNRSDFIRDAIEAEIRRQNVPIHESAARMPDRTRIQRYPEHQVEGTPTNELGRRAETNSKRPASEKELVLKAVADAENPGVKYAKKQRAGLPSGKTSGQGRGGRANQDGQRPPPGQAPK